MMKRALIEAMRLLLPIALIAWGGSAAIAAARQWLAGGAVSAELLLAPPAAWADLMPLGMMLLFVGLEWLARRRDPQWTRALPRNIRTDLFFGIADNTGATRVLTLLFSLGLSEWLMQQAGLRQLSPGLADQPLVAQLVLIYLVGSFCLYWSHRLLHTRLMWPLHAMHHSARHLSALTNSRQHPLDEVLMGVPSNAALLMLGFSPQALLVSAVLVSAHAALQHSAVPFPLWLERYLISGPLTHRVHHSLLPQHHNTNFGMLVIWDRLFGTFRLPPPDAAQLPTGVEDPGHDLDRPLLAIVQSTRVWLRGLAAALRPARSATAQGARA